MLSWDQVIVALENNKYKWRTIRGLAKELKAEESEVLRVMNEHIGDIIKSAVPAETGEDLFTTRRHYRHVASSFDKITSSVTTSVSASASQVMSSNWSVTKEDDDE